MASEELQREVKKLEQAISTKDDERERFFGIQRWKHMKIIHDDELRGLLCDIPRSMADRDGNVHGMSEATKTLMERLDTRLHEKYGECPL